MLLDQTVLLGLSILAYVAQAMTAALAAGRRSMDWMGVCLLGSITALGGGSMRDMLLGHYPLVWVKEPWLLLLTAGAAALRHRARAHHPSPAHRLPRARRDRAGRVHHRRLRGGAADEPAAVDRHRRRHDHRLRRRRAARRALQRCAAAVSQRALRQRFGGDRRALCRGPARRPQSGSWRRSAAFVVGIIFRLLAIRYRWEMPKFVYSRDWN